MTSSIEKSLSRIANRNDTVDSKIEAMADALPPPSAFASICGDNLAEVMNAAAIDNLTSAAARLRALHSGSDELPAATGRNPFGKPAMPPKVIDGEFTEVKSQEEGDAA